ncbi:MAG: amidohydrolase family protein [Candidatus Falkowbacteria bacterium]
MKSQRIIDIHCHLFAFNHGDGFVHSGFVDGLRMNSYLRAIGVKPYETGLPALYNLERIHEDYRNTLLRDIDASAFLSQIVVLPFDGVYGPDGKLDYDHTVLYVSNDAVWELHRCFPDKIIPAASINPARRDWREELDKCAERGIRIIKWLPGVMGFSPEGTACYPPSRAELKLDHIKEFYARLRGKGMAILTHVGFEFALPVIDGIYNRLEAIRLPVTENIRVCAAHCAGGLPYVNHARQFRRVKIMAEGRDNLYFDTAGMSSPHRKARLKASLADKVIRRRLVYGSDYPIPIREKPFREELKAAGLLGKFQDTKNPFDRDILIKRAMGMDDDDFARGYELVS